MIFMRILILPALAFATLASVPVQAQSLPGSGGGISQLGGMSGAASQPGGMPGASGDKKERVIPPDAVPGAKPRADSVTPLKGGTSDLAPTEALFDAINRGDILTARDAINRGADLDSANLLGLTPIELSVDLGRNDISFLLLSLRGASGSNQASQQHGTAAAAPVAMTQADKRAMAKAMRANAAASKMASSGVREATPSGARAPTLFAGNGGTPIASAGFLGFDHR